MEAVKHALVKAIRTFLQCFAGALVGLPVVTTVTDVKVQAPAILVALYVSLSAAVISFCQNLAEAM